MKLKIFFLRNPPLNGKKRRLQRNIVEPAPMWAAPTKTRKQRINTGNVRIFNLEEEWNKQIQNLFKGEVW